MLRHLKLRQLLVGGMGGGAAHMTELHLKAGFRRKNAGVERRLEETVVVLPVEQRVEPHERRVGIDDQVLLDLALVAQPPAAAQPPLDRAVCDHFARDQLARRAQLARQIRVNVPVVPTERHVLTEQEGVQRSSLPQFAPAAAIHKRRDRAVFVKGDDGERRGERVLLVKEGGGRVRSRVGQRERRRRQRRQRHPRHGGEGVSAQIGHALAPRARDDLARREGGIPHVVAREREGVDRRHGIVVRRGGQCVRRPLAQRLPHGAHLLLAHGVRLGDTRAGQDVVELVEQQRLEQRTHRLVGCLAPVRRRLGDGEELEVVQPDLDLAVVALDLVLVGERAAVQLEIHLARIQRRLGHFPLERVHEVADRGVRRTRASRQILYPPRRLQHLEFGSAAAVAFAIRHEPATGRGFGANARRRPGEIGGIGTTAERIEMGQHPRAVQPLPVKRVIGEAVGVVPAHFGCEEVFHTAALHDLWNGGAVAEGVREQKTVGGVAEPALRVTLPPQKLAHHALAAGNVAVALDPYAAVRLIASRAHRVRHPLKQGGVVAAQHFAVAGGALHKAVLRVARHQVELVGIGAGALFDGVVGRPQPRGVHVGVTDQPDDGTVRARIAFCCQHRGERLAQRGESRAKMRIVRAVRVVIDRLVRRLERAQQLGAAKIVQRLDRQQVVDHVQVEIGVIDQRVTHAHVERGVFRHEVAAPPLGLLKRLSAQHRATAPHLHRHLEHLARPRGGAQTIDPVIAADRRLAAVGKNAHLHAVHVIERLAIEVRKQKQLLTVQLRRDGEPSAIPVEGVLFAVPLTRRQRLPALLRDGKEVFGRLEHLRVGERSDFSEDLGGKLPLQAGELIRRAYKLSVVEHSLLLLCGRQSTAITMSSNIGGKTRFVGSARRHAPFPSSDSAKIRDGYIIPARRMQPFLPNLQKIGAFTKKRTLFLSITPIGTQKSRPPTESHRRAVCDRSLTAASGAAYTAP